MIDKNIFSRLTPKDYGFILFDNRSAKAVAVIARGDFDPALVGDGFFVTTTGEYLTFVKCGRTTESLH